MYDLASIGPFKEAYMADLIAIGYPDEATILKSSLSKDAEKELQAALHGEPVAVQR